MQKYQVTLRALATALLEIRATESLAGARTLADIFHKVPAMMVNGMAEKEILDEILSISARYGCRDQVSSFMKP
jgi:hypothetical protein